MKLTYLSKNFLLKLALCSFYSMTAQAGLEFKIGYGMHSGTPKEYNDFLQNTCTPRCEQKAGSLKGLHADLVYVIPVIGLGLGVRYESLSDKVDLSGTSANENFTRTAILLNYRVWNTGLFFGPIFSYGLSNSSEIKVESNPAIEAKAKSASSASFGVEAGVFLGSLILGAEAGVLQTTAKEFKTPSDQSINGLTTVSRGGVSTRAFIGYAF